ncbi:MAG: threonine--tRNA ligase, partial [Lentisphaeria bacterium]|nr:threonine--tRNA ligase [Lentisphaeria bacterium]
VDNGGGAFYGPKIDLKVKDAIGREWQTTTIQVDFNLPERFDLTYIGEDGKKHQPYMVHRALFGSLERFFGILIEQYAGAFPMWLAPVQAKVLPITEKQHEYAGKVAAELSANGFRVELDDRAESLGARIKDARNQRTNYIIVIGEREAENGEVGVRSRREGELGAMKLADLMKKMQFEVANKII